MKATITKHGAKWLGDARLAGKTVTCTINERRKADNVYYGLEMVPVEPGDGEFARAMGWK